MSRNYGLRHKRLLGWEALEAECVRVLRTVPGYEALQVVEIRASPLSKQGANWKIARIHPDIRHISREQWGRYTSRAAELMAQFDLRGEFHEE